MVWPHCDMFTLTRFSGGFDELDGDDFIIIET